MICHKIKDLDEYYAHKKMADGHLGKCKECTKMHSKQRIERLRNDPKWVESERKRGREKFKRLYRGDSAWKPLKKYDGISYKKKYPEKYKAIIKSQRIYCPIGYHKHHWSYLPENAKDVIILSKDAHYFFHVHHIYDQERMGYRNRKGVLTTKQEQIDFLKNNGFESSFPDLSQIPTVSEQKKLNQELNKKMRS